MLSIIVCSIDVINFKNLSESIENSIGEIAYEIIRIDNKTSNFDIARAYNNGALKANYPYLLFVHEDVLFHTNSWGKILLDNFISNPKIGVIGVAGSKVKTKIPSGWWENPARYLAINIIQHHPNNIKKRRNIGFDGARLEEVAVIDGVFIALRLDKRIVFNEKISGFHNYDQSISLDYRKFGYKVMVVNSILIEHFSSGNKNEDWVKSSVIFHQKYNLQLPQNILSTPINKNELSDLQLRFIYTCLRTGLKKVALKFWVKYLIKNPFKITNIEFLNSFLKTLLP